MDRIRERAEMQLRLIEQSYFIAIQNREEVAAIMAERVSDNRDVLRACTSLNYWVATNNITGDVIVPLDLVRRIIDGL